MLASSEQVRAPKPDWSGVYDLAFGVIGPYSQGAAAQGLNIGRSGRVYINQDSEGQVWVGGAVHPVVLGQIAL